MERVQGKRWEVILHEILEEEKGVTEIEANGTTSLFIKKDGERREIKDVFSSPEDYDEKTEDLISTIAEKDENKFLVEGRIELTTGETARVHVVLPPASDHPQVTIARKTGALNNLKALMAMKSFNEDAYRFIKAAIDINLTIVLSGPTGAGKTTFLEALTHEMNQNDRIGVVEDVPELILPQGNVTYLHSTPWAPGINPNDVATLDWCVKQINRQRTDKLIIGETRGEEFYGFITGANSGMEGSVTSIHANDTRGALQKMTQFVLLAKDQPVRTANESIASAIDLIIQLGTNDTGGKRVKEIALVSKTLGITESAVIATTPLFSWDDSADSVITTSLAGSDEVLKAKFEKKGYNVTNFKKSSPLGASTIRPITQEKGQRIPIFKRR